MTSPGLPLPTWGELARIDYQPWDRDHLSIGTAELDIAAAVSTILTAAKPLLASSGGPQRRSAHPVAPSDEVIAR